MGVDLIGIGRSYSWHGWRALFDLGVAFGWRPAGALKPLNPIDQGNHSYPADDYPGERDGYFTNDRQWGDRARRGGVVGGPLPRARQ
jgi:hypothetical protein